MSDVQLNSNRVITKNNNEQINNEQNERLQDANSNQAIFKTSQNSNPDEQQIKETVEEKENERIVTKISSDGTKTVQITSKTDGSMKEIVTNNDRVITTIYNAEGKRLKQSVSKDGITNDVEYDGNGNTLTIVQNGESPAVIAQKFGVSTKALLNINKYYKDKLGNKYFLVGQKIKIPTEINADNKKIRSRKSASDAQKDYISSGAAEKEAAANEEVANRKNITWTEQKYNTFEEIARSLFRNEGNNNPSNLQLNARIKDLIKDNPTLKDGQLKGKKILAGVGQGLYKHVVAKENERNVQVATKKDEAVQKQSAKQIVADLKQAIKGWNDTDKIQEILARIDNPVEMAEVNKLLASEGYKADDMYSSIEKFIYEENNNTSVHTYNSTDYMEKTVQKWISNGTLKGKDAIDAQARMAARVICDGGDGMGTNCDKIKKGIHMIKAPTGNKPEDAKAVYDKVNQIISKHSTFYGIGAKSKDLMDYLDGELWDGEVKYLQGILAQNDALQGTERAEAVSGLVREAVEYAGTDIEYLQQALKGIKSPEDRKAVEAKLKEYCDKKGIKPQIKGQDYLQAILYDECDTFAGINKDHKEIRKFNEMMIAQGAYSEDEIIKLRAEQAVIQILDGGFDNIQDALAQVKDKNVLAQINIILKSEKNLDLDGLLDKNIKNQTKIDLLKAELASNNLLSDKDATYIALRLIQSTDFNTRAKGISAIRTSAQAQAVDKSLKASGSSLAQVMEKFNKEKGEYKNKAAIWDGLAYVFGSGAEYISDRYRDNTDISDNLYTESETAVSIPQEKKEVYDATVKDFEAKLNKMKQDYQDLLDNQGWISGAVNEFCSIYNIGTTRDDIEARIEHDTESLRLYKLAAEGKLQKIVNGKLVNISFEDVFKERQSTFVTANGASISAINNAISPKEAVTLDTDKTTKIAQQGTQLAAMDYAKEYIAQSWQELNSATNTNDNKQLSTAIYSTLEKISQMSGKELSLNNFGYTTKNGVIVDNNGKAVPVMQLKNLVATLKQGLSDISKDLLGITLPSNSNNDKVSDLLNKGYESKLKEFKEEYKKAYGQEAPDDILDSYRSTIQNGVMAVNIVVAIGAVVAAPFTGGGSLAVFLAGAGATLVTQGLEQATDANGWTNSEWTATATDALWNGALAMAGMKVGQIADKAVSGGYTIAAKVLAKNEQIIKTIAPNISPDRLKLVSTIVARTEATFGEVSSDVIQDLMQTYCVHGEFNIEQFTTNLIMSAAGNTAGHVYGGVTDVRGSHPSGKPDARITDDALPVRRTDDVAPARRADDVTPVRRADDVTPARRTDDVTPARRTDDIVPARRTDDVTPVRRTDDVVPARTSEEVSAPRIDTDKIPNTRPLDDMATPDVREPHIDNHTTRGTNPRTVVRTENLTTPREIKILGSSFDINKIETLADGNKILYTDENFIIHLNKDNLATKVIEPDKNVSNITYESGTDRIAFVEKVNERNEITEKLVTHKDGSIDLYDYSNGTKYSASSMNEVGVTTYIALHDYPKVLNENIYIFNMKKQIKSATDIDELKRLQTEFNEFNDAYKNRTDLTSEFKAKAEEIIRKNSFVDENTLSNLNKFSLKQNQELLISFNDKIVLGNNGFTIDLNDPAIKSRLEILADGESITIGSPLSTKADIKMKYADDSVAKEHITITRQGDSYVVKDCSNGSTKIYTDKTPEQININEATLPSKAKKSDLPTLEQSPLDDTLEQIRAMNNKNNKIKVSNGNGTVDYCKSGIVSKLIYKDGKLVASFVNGSYYSYTPSGKRILIDEKTYSKQLNDALISHYKSNIDSVAPVDKADLSRTEALVQMEPTILSNNAHLSLSNQCDIYLNTEPFKSMKNGDSILVGKLDGLDNHASWHQFNGVADEHILVQKIDGKYVVTSLSDKGTVVISTTKKTPLTPIEQKIQISNKPTEITTSKPLDINDPMYNDIPKISEYLHSKMEAQMGVVKPDEISAWADNISKTHGVPKEEVLDIMSRLTQFGSYSQLKQLGKKLSDLGIGNFYTASGISTNNAFNYIAKKKHQFELSGSKTAFVLDDAGLKHLESLNATKRQAFLNDVNSGNIVLIDLDGTGLTIGNNNYSYTALDGGQSLEAMTEAVIMQMKDGKSLEQVLNGSHQERIKDIFGADATSKVETVKLNSKPVHSANTVADQIKPNLPTTNQIRATIEGYVEGLGFTGADAQRAKSLLTKYIDNMLKMNSNDTFMELLRRKHAQIEDQVQKLGKTMDDVIYVYPTKGKSFELINYMYGKANGIDSSKFIFTNGTTKLPDGKVVVLLDDVVGSGATMIHQEFKYDIFTKNNPTCSMIFSPITCAQEGHNKITSHIKSTGKSDALIYDDSMVANFTALTSKLSKEDTILLEKILGSVNYFNKSRLCTSFQYMVPDNCSVFSGYILNYNLNNPAANKMKPHDTDILNRINDLIRLYDGA